MNVHKMNSANPRFETGRVLLLFICSILTPLSAQNERPRIDVSMYFVSEKDACPPDGYTQGKCDELTFKRLEEMLRSEKYIASTQHSIPPENFRLGSNLLDSIEAYSEDCPPNRPCVESSRRYAVILTFKVVGKDCVGCSIMIRRVPPKDSQFVTYSDNGKLSEQSRWVNHQRADVFLPSNRVRWRLEIGQWRWDLRTRR